MASITSILSKAFPFAAIALISCGQDAAETPRGPLSDVALHIKLTDGGRLTPRGLCIYAYPLEAGLGSAQRFDFDYGEQMTLNLMPGRYSIVAFNNDTEAILFSGAKNFDTHTAYTRDGNIFEPILGRGGITRAEGSPTVDNRITISPDMLWAASLPEYQVTDSGSDNLELELKCVTQSYSILVEDVENVEGVTDICGTVTGLAHKVKLSDLSLSEEPATIPFQCFKGDGNSIFGSFTTFGHNESLSNEHHLVLYFWMESGSKWYIDVDITDQIDNAADSDNVIVSIPKISLPAEETSNWIEPSVGDWTSEETEIIL